MRIVYMIRKLKAVHYETDKVSRSQQMIFLIVKFAVKVHEENLGQLPHLSFKEDYFYPYLCNFFLLFFVGPLSLSRLTDGGKAAVANVSVGDLVLSIGGISTEGMTHLEAQNMIKACTDSLNLTLQKVPVVAKPAPAPAQKEEPYEVFKPVPITSTSPAAPKGTVLAKEPDIVVEKTPPIRSALRKHIVDTDTEFYHTSIHSDASKKRLIEDTEDWHPRTGTSQSRSFHILAQITGTEGIQVSENETEKKAKEKVSAQLFSPKYAKLRDWHHGVSARVLNVQ
nr:PREDICTED: PDZ and LIM domain protein 5-like [Latimeria chalumnae]|eukprot:XP_014348637.1 PREDICTED: PDZ and LIM domain protein 5-like [Latimeria chalumnae]